MDLMVDTDEERVLMGEAIKAGPGTTPWYIFVDWLEDHGKYARAERMRKRNK